MRTLYLLRHFKARRQPQASDRERELHRSAAGQGAALSAYLAKLNRPLDRILCSPSRRTRGTLDLIRPALSGKLEVRYPDSLYLASPDTLTRLVLDTEGTVQALMLIGHNEGLHQFALMLSKRDQLPRLATFPTGALAVLEFDIGDWPLLAPGRGRLVAAIDPDELVEDL